MKKLFLLLLIVVVSSACSHKSGKAAGNTDSQAVEAAVDAGADKHAEAWIRQRIDTIYKTVGKKVNDSKGNLTDYIQNPFNLDSAYCSQRYYQLMTEASNWCEATGEILYDYDYWVKGQDVSDDWSYKVAKVYEMTDSTALADLIIHNFSDQETTIALRFERDDWYIDDFSPSPDGEDDKKYLRSMIQQGKETREKAGKLAGKWGWVGEDCPELLLDLELGDYGLKVARCDAYRQYGFDHAIATFNGNELYVNELEYDEKAMETKRELRLNLSLDGKGDLTGECYIRHPLSDKDYEGPIRLRRDYFFYRDGARKTLSDYAE